MAKTTATAKAKKPTAAENKEIEKRWGKDLVAAGWTAIPNVLFECSQQLGLKHLDVVIILHLAGYWWHAGNDPYPTKQTLAAKIGVTPRTIQRSIAELEDKGYIKRHPRTSSWVATWRTAIPLRASSRQQLPSQKPWWMLAKSKRPRAMAVLRRKRPQR